MGYRLSDEEADEMMRECDPHDGRIYYRDYRSMLLDNK
jgi:Ca2+-binding EF-hand superfamily protein